MNLKNQNRNVIIGFLLIVLIFILIQFYYEKSNKAQNKTTVGKVFKQVEKIGVTPGTVIDYYFYVDGNKTKGNTKIFKDFRLQTKNKFFTVKYESDNPKNSSILLNQQIINESLIRKAGF
ncbi:hypothetical protein BC962_3036 [Gillisia mitskevichiae]|uniref:DUF1093 domain-containing protein n=1 Tax=Gillisia mitskevichiae TaxID=270921 RepID=A0A495P251_9FLAO|nr:hypothetical protein [Gillisia mitskevichiae]RKS42749.1 hypothetical protein BC962_3036 [Gillisia mitskevichiae]